jgi:hypothetical protein
MSMASSPWDNHGNFPGWALDLANRANAATLGPVRLHVFVAVWLCTIVSSLIR